MEPLIRVGIIDDHPGVRVGIRHILANAEDIVVVGEGGNGLEAIQLAQQEVPDLLLLDVEIPILRGDVVMQHLRESGEAVKVLAISSYNDPAYIQGMLQNGAAGYITKEEAPVYLLEAIHSIVQKHVKWISPMVSKKVSNVILGNKDLSGPELDLLRSLVMGKSDKQIMSIMKINQQEKKRILESLMKKFEVSSRAQLKQAAECIISTQAC